MTITLVRHGQTAWNVGRRFQGRSDIPLSDVGRAQAAAASRALASDRFDVVYSSDLIRAVETAEMIAAPHDLAIHRDERLREFDFGEWEGLTWAQITQRWPHLLEHGGTEAKYYQPTGGESFDDVRERVRSFLADVRARREGQVLVVTHAGVLHAAVDGLAEGVSFDQASITRIAMDDDGTRLITLNDVSHLNSAG